jgi:hypothetical protein
LRNSSSGFSRKNELLKEGNPFYKRLTMPNTKTTRVRRYKILADVLTGASLLGLVVLVASQMVASADELLNRTKVAFHQCADGITNYETHGSQTANCVEAIMPGEGVSGIKGGIEINPSLPARMFWYGSDFKIRCSYGRECFAS